jgi:hypothetical protein
MTAAWTSSPREVFFENEHLNTEAQGSSQRIWIFLLSAALLFLISELLLSNGTLKVASDDVRKAAALNS